MAEDTVVERVSSQWARAIKDIAREWRSIGAQAAEAVREEIKQARDGKSGARMAGQALAKSWDEARRVGAGILARGMRAASDRLAGLDHGAAAEPEIQRPEVEALQPPALHPHVVPLDEHRKKRAAGRATHHRAVRSKAAKAKPRSKAAGRARKSA